MGSLLAFKYKDGLAWPSSVLAETSFRAGSGVVETALAYAASYRHGPEGFCTVPSPPLLGIGFEPRAGRVIFRRLSSCPCGPVAWPVLGRL